MGSKGRIPPSHLRRLGPGPGMVHPDPYGPPIRAPPGGFPPYDVLPPPEVMEQKLAAQHVEMQKLATENQRLATTHGILRQELAAAQHELQMLHAHIGDMKSEGEQQMRGLMDKITRMEAELRASESVKKELQQAHTEAQSLVSVRQDLISKVQQLTQELQRAHSDVQQIPFLLSELDGLRQEYQHCRATYDYEKKLYNDHLESLQVMEKNYLTMAREVDKLRAELTNSSNFDRRTGGPYGSSTGYNESDASGNYSVGQNAHGNGYGISQGQGPLLGRATGGGTADAGVAASGGVTPPAGAPAQSGPGSAPAPTLAPPPPPPPPSAPTPAPVIASYDASRAPSYDMDRGPAGHGYDAHRGIDGPGYNAHRGSAAPGYEAQRGPGHDGQRAAGYEAHRRTAYEGNASNFNGHGAPLYDAQRGSRYDVQRGGYDPKKAAGYGPQRSAGYDVSSRAAGPQGQVASLHNVPYGSATPPARGAAIGYEAPPRGGNNVRR